MTASICKEKLDTGDKVSGSRQERLVMCCEYCGVEFKGVFDEAIKQGWQHGWDASFCPKHNV